MTFRVFRALECAIEYMFVEINHLERMGIRSFVVWRMSGNGSVNKHLSCRDRARLKLGKRSSDDVRELTLCCFTSDTASVERR